MEKIEVEVWKLENALTEAENCRAWPVAIKLARILGHQEAVNRYVDKWVEGQKWHIPVKERTPERLALEKENFLARI